MAFKNEQIYRTLWLINRRFNQAIDRKRRFLFTEIELLSKLAVIELGGWVEESFDECLLQYANRHIVNKSEVDKIKKSVIGRVYGFSYEYNLVPLFERVLGMVNFRRVIRHYMADGTLDVLKAQLDVLKQHRDRAAHKNWSGVSLNFPAPTTVLNIYKTIYPIMNSIKKDVSKI